MVSGFLLPRQKRLEMLFYMMAAFALLGPSFGIPITDDFNLTLFRVAFVLLAAGFILRLATQKSLEASYMFPIRWYLAFYAFWLFYAVLSLTWVVSLGDGIRYTIFLGTMLLLLVSFPYFLSTEKKFWKMQRILFAVFAVIVFYAVFESITLLHLPSSRAFGYSSAVVTSFFTNQNDLATCVTLGLPFVTAGLYMLPLQKKYKWLLYLTGVMSIYILIATGSRSNTAFALPLSAAVLAILLPLALERKHFTRKMLWYSIGGLALGALIVSVMSSTFLSAEAREAAKTKLSSTFGIIGDLKQGEWSVEEGTSKEVEEGNTGQSVTVRKYLLLNGLKFLQKSHYMGVGSGNIEPLMEGQPKVNKVNLHNWWGEVLVNFGVIIFTLYMIMYVSLLWRLFKMTQRKKTPHLSTKLRWAAVASLSALIGYVFGGIAPSTAIHYTPMWVCLGVGLAVVVLGEVQKKTQNER